MDKIKLTGQLRKAWIQLELAKREKTNELWTIEAQIEKIKSKIKMDVRPDRTFLRDLKNLDRRLGVKFNGYRDWETDRKSVV